MPRTLYDIDAFANRGLPITLEVLTATVDAADLSDVRFAFDTVEKTGLSATDTTTGIQVGVNLTVSDLALSAGQYHWELTAVLNGERVSLLHGRLRVQAEWT